MRNDNIFDFEKALEAAIRGDSAAICRILHEYEPLITNVSMLNGKYDEDLAQRIRIKIALSIAQKKFEIIHQKGVHQPP